MVLVAHLDRGQHGAQHDRPLPEARGLERASFEQALLAPADPLEHLGVQREVRDHPAGGREKVRHRPQVHEDDVTGDADTAFGFGCVGPALHDAGEQIVGSVGRCQRVAGTDRDGEQLLDTGHRGAFGNLASGGHGAHGFGVDERGRAVELVERRDQFVEARGR